jgi:hypothetical protein
MWGDACLNAAVARPGGGLWVAGCTDDDAGDVYPVIALRN